MVQLKSEKFSSSSSSSTSFTFPCIIHWPETVWHCNKTLQAGAAAGSHIHLCTTCPAPSHAAISGLQSRKIETKISNSQITMSGSKTVVHLPYFVIQDYQTVILNFKNKDWIIPCMLQLLLCWQPYSWYDMFIDMKPQYIHVTLNVQWSHCRDTSFPLERLVIVVDVYDKCCLRGQ